MSSMTLDRARRSVRRALALAGCAAALVCSTPALAADANLNAAEKRKVRGAIGLLEQAWKPCKDKKVSEVFGTGMEYEKIKKNGADVEPTIQDMINHLKNMLDKDNIITRDSMAAWGTVDVKRGVDADKIILRKKLLEDLCAAGTSAVDKMDLKLQLVATTSNELTHVFQKWLGSNNKQLCDGERDSDCASIKALQPLLDGMSKPDGSPHPDIAGINGDAQKVDGLGKCMMDLGVTSAADIMKVHEKLKNKLGKEDADATKRKGYKGRKQRFGEDLSASPVREWNTWYGGGRDGPAEEFVHETFTGGGFTTVVGNDLTTTRAFTFALGHSLIISRALLNDSGQKVLVSAVVDSTGTRRLFAWHDIDGDGLPDLSTRAKTVLTATSPGSHDVFSMQIYPAVPAELNAPGRADAGLLVFDRFDGSLHLLTLDPNGAPMGLPVELFRHPLLTSGPAPRYLLAFSIPNPADPPSAQFVRFTFGTKEDGDPEVVWFDVPVSGGPVIPSLAPGQTLAQAVAPNQAPLLQTLTPSAAGPVTLIGNPGETITFSTIGRGVKTALASAFIGSSGNSGPIPTSGPIIENDLFLFENGVGGAAAGYLPRLGANIDCLMNDENGDGRDDRLHLSVEPTRLHYLAGVLAEPPTSPVKSFLFETAIQPAEHVGFGPWSDVDGRILTLPETEVMILRLTGFDPPVYVQSLHDFDGDSIPDEAVVLSRGVGDAAFSASFYSSATSLAPTLDQVVGLPASLEPDRLLFQDVDADGRLDVVVKDFVPLNPEVCLLNSGDPAASRFDAVTCSPPPCCLGNADKVRPSPVDFADISASIANYGTTYTGTGIGDSDCDGDVDFADITASLSAFGSLCP